MLLDDKLYQNGRINLERRDPRNSSYAKRDKTAGQKAKRTKSPDLRGGWKDPEGTGGGVAEMTNFLT